MHAQPFEIIYHKTNLKVAWDSMPPAGLPPPTHTSRPWLHPGSALACSPTMSAFKRLCAELHRDTYRVNRFRRIFPRVGG